MSKKKGWLSRLFGGKQDNTTYDETTQNIADLDESPIIESAPEAPSSEKSISEEPISEEPISEEPISEEPISEEPISEEPISEEPISEEPISEEAISEEAISEEAISEKSISEEPISEESVSEESVSKKIGSQKTEPPQEKPKKEGLFARLRSQLTKTRDNLTSGFADLFLGKKEIDEEILEELETRLLLADVGINATMAILDEIREEVDRKALSDYDGLFNSLRTKMEDILTPVEKPLTLDDSKTPYVILMIGVNGVGKTTTIGKLAKQFQQQGKSVMLAAGDTFRAAAVEQLQVWGERNNIPVISQKEGADPASVVFDAVESAKAKKVDILIADTAGRLHTDSGLMQELAKIHRVIKRLDDSAPHEVMLVVDASTGQNALNQARQFNETVPLSGITFTKMDGTAKGGIIFAIANELSIPVRYIGVGESIDDLRTFNAKDFVSALISDTQQ